MLLNFTHVHEVAVHRGCAYQVIWLIKNNIKKEDFFFNSLLKMKNGILKLLESLFGIRLLYKVCGVTFQIIQTLFAGLESA